MQLFLNLAILGLVVWVFWLCLLRPMAEYAWVRRTDRWFLTGAVLGLTLVLFMVTQGVH